MQNKNSRPVYLNPLQIHLPISGVVSILHRITGLLLVLALPFLLYTLQRSLEGPEGFVWMQNLSEGLTGTLVVFFLSWLWFQHLLSGLRHIGFNLGIGSNKFTARLSAWMTLATSLILSVVILLWR